MELTGRANAASWKGPTIDPLVIHPRSPCHYLNTRVIRETQNSGHRFGKSGQGGEHNNTTDFNTLLYKRRD